MLKPLVFKAQLGIAENNDTGHYNAHDKQAQQCFGKAIEGGTFCHKVKFADHGEQHPDGADEGQQAQDQVHHPMLEVCLYTKDHGDGEGYYIKMPFSHEADQEPAAVK